MHPSPPRLDLVGATLPQLAHHLDVLGIGAKHAGRVFRGIHRDHLELRDIPNLGRHAEVLARHTERTVLSLETRRPAADGSVRLVFRLADGERIEGVLLPNKDHQRATLCVSSQVGCAMACAFCATGTMGLTRHLTAAEIVGQVHAARAELQGSGRRLTRLCLLYTSPSPRDKRQSRMPSSA